MRNEQTPRQFSLQVVGAGGGGEIAAGKKALAGPCSWTRPAARKTMSSASQVAWPRLCVVRRDFGAVGADFPDDAL